MPPFILRKYRVIFTHRGNPKVLSFIIDDISAADAHDAASKGLGHLEGEAADHKDWVLTEVRVIG